MSIKEKTKEIVPKALWSLFRNTWFHIKDILWLFEKKEQNIKHAGITLFYNKGNSVVVRLKKEGNYENEMCDHIVKKLKEKENPVLMDVGANIGLVSTYLLNKIPSVHIYAFEPGPVQAELLQKTIDENLLQKNIKLYQVALADTTGTQTFYTHVTRDQAKDGLFDTERGEKTKKIEVQTSTLDEWWRKAGRPRVDVVKIDTEGAELLVLRGASEFLKEVRPVIYLEIEPSNLKAYPYTHIDIIQYFTEAQYQIETLFGKSVTLENIDLLLKKNDTFVAKSL